MGRSTIQVLINADVALWPFKQERRAEGRSQEFRDGQRRCSSGNFHGLMFPRAIRGKAFMMEIFTWRDSSIPDNAPDEITRIGQQICQLVAAAKPTRIDFPPVHILTL